MSIAAAAARRLSLFGEVGKAGAHVLFPDEFEFYNIAFELLNYKGESLFYFAFPVMPSSLVISAPTPFNLIKTAGGITVLSDPRYEPEDITLVGNFGRSFKYLSTDSKYKELTTAWQRNESTAETVFKFLDDTVRTGYGCCRTLKYLQDESRKLDGDKPRSLYFYNMAFNTYSLVKIRNLVFNQNEQMSQIWNYQLQLTTLAPYEALNSETAKKNLSARLAFENIAAKMIQNTVNTAMDLVDKGFNFMEKAPKKKINPFANNKLF